MAPVGHTAQQASWLVSRLKGVFMNGKVRRHMRSALVFAGLMSALLGLPGQAYADDVMAGYPEAHVSTKADASGRLGERSWYGGMISFSTQGSTNQHYYDGNNVGIEVSASCQVSGTFTVSLYRNGIFISSASLRRNGFSRAEWNNVGPGSYRFIFSKSNDGATVTCSDIAMFSW